MTRLEALLAAIDPDRTLNKMARRVDHALNSFPYASGTTATPGEFEATMTAFYCHVENVALRLSPPRDIDSYMDWGQCRQILMEAYGRSGVQVAEELARTGKEGGLFGVLRTVANRMGERYARDKIRTEVLRFWNALSADELHEAATEYMDRWGHILPPELTEAWGARVRSSFVNILQEHPRIINEMRGIRAFDAPARGR